MSFIDSIKRAGSNVINTAEKAKDNLVNGTKTAVTNTVNFANKVEDKIESGVKRGMTTIVGNAKVLGKGIIHGTEFVGNKLADGAKTVGNVAVKTLEFQASVTRFALEKSLDGAKAIGTASVRAVSSFVTNRVGDPTPPDAQGLTFAETKSATSLAYGANKGEIYRFPDGKTWEVVDVKGNTNTGFRAIALKPTDPSDQRTIVSYAGTDPKSIKDWKNNFAQGAGLTPKQYREAVDFANKWKAIDGNNVTLTGHSLGGGLASYASINTGLRATALNSAPLALNHLGGNPLRSDVRNNPNITQYYVPSEVLTDLDGANPLDVRPGNKIAVAGKYPTSTFEPISDTIFSVMNHLGSNVTPWIPDPVKVN